MILNVPTEEELKRYYNVVWETKNFQEESRKPLEIYSKLSISEAQEQYNEVINKFPLK
ncbi:hypothetical protein VQL36_09330 [Chengkuizengella sp. SCS-71B]|uniref:hypothetical protein n=1 Tax=Chengkuizengella sp. SCS-71B TaxID=3115290 RepID=UPI0032C21630